MKVLEFVGLEPVLGFRNLHTDVIMRKSLGAKAPSMGNFDKESLIAAYEANEADVKRHCKENNIDLLVYEIGSGWEPLCEFLDVPIPSVPYPRTNDTSEFQRVIHMLNMIGWACVALPAVGIACFLYWLYSQ